MQTVIRGVGVGGQKRESCFLIKCFSQFNFYNFLKRKQGLYPSPDAGLFAEQMSDEQLLSDIFTKGKGEGNISQKW